jgi:hypothetical protein
MWALPSPEVIGTHEEFHLNLPYVGRDILNTPHIYADCKRSILTNGPAFLTGMLSSLAISST